MLRKFQFTHPGGVRQEMEKFNRPLLEFQFTHPGGVRHSPIVEIDDSPPSFNSRTREGCDADDA